MESAYATHLMSCIKKLQASKSKSGALKKCQLQVHPFSLAVLTQAGEDLEDDNMLAAMTANAAAL